MAKGRTDPNDTGSWEYKPPRKELDDTPYQQDPQSPDPQTQRMATPVEHEKLYATLRAKILARYFAIGRYFRTNFLSLSNTLADLPDDLNNKIPEEEIRNELRRWNVKNHDRENPFMLTGQLFAMLSIEHHFGHPASSNILRLGMETIGTMYPFQADSYGLPVRWDPVTSDNWIVSEERLVACRNFLIDENGAYQFCVPATDPRHIPYRALETMRSLLPRQDADAYCDILHKEYFHQNRSWEESMDELTGLVAAYSIAHKFLAATKPDIDVTIVNQARKLADTLAGKGYLLLRPCGGLNARGATGALPAMEYVYVRAFQRITGESFPSRLDFIQAMKKAGYWRLLEGPVNRLVAASYAGSLLFTPGFMAFLGANSLVLGTFVSPAIAGTALALFLHSDTFDVSNKDAAEEVALGYIFKETNPRARFQTWMKGMGFGLGQYARNFPPFLALSALDDTDSVVREAFLTLYANSLTEAKLDRYGMNSAFAAATAVLMGGDYEDRLLNLLNLRFDYFNEERDLHLDREGDITNELWLAMDYLSALALAWLHAKRRAAAGTPIATPGFPIQPHNFTAWPVPVVPAIVLKHLQEVRKVVLGSSPLPETDIDLFDPLRDNAKPAVPPPVLPSHPTELIFSSEYFLSPTQSLDLQTGVILKWGDEYEIEAEGSIWAGDILIGRNGPEGVTDRTVDDARWPLHSGLDPLHAHPFALLGRLGGWFYVGRGFTRRRYLGYDPLPLFLRINDTRLGDGDGEFKVTVRVWGEPPAQLIIRAQPIDPPLNQPISLIIEAYDARSHEPRNGTVKLTNYSRGIKKELERPTGKVFNVTLQSKTIYYQKTDVKTTLFPFVTVSVKDYPEISMRFTKNEEEIE